MTVMNRKSAEFWWNKFAKRNIKIPDNVAYFNRNDAYEKWDIVTWSDIHKKRTDKILSNIEMKRLHIKVKPCLVWVFSHGCWMMGGYYTMIKTLKKEYYLNFRGKGLIGETNEKELQMKVMQIFPLCLPMDELFYEWMIFFAKKFKNKSFHKEWKNQGVSKAYCKIDEYDNLIDIISINRFKETKKCDGIF